MKPKYNNILIDAVMHLGDLIHATTLIPLLKQQYPDARISYLVKPELVDLFKNIDNIEYVIPYKYKSKGDYFSVFRMAKEIKKYNFDLYIIRSKIKVVGNDVVGWNTNKGRVGKSFWMASRY